MTSRPLSPSYSNRIRPLLAGLVVTLCAQMVIPRSVRANGLSGDADRFATGPMNELFLASGLLLPLVEDGHRGREEMVRGFDSLGVSLITTEALKFTVRERRPDRSDRQSFPSGHSTAAFSIATMEARFHPRQAPLWYAGAILIGASRVGLHRHYIHDVVAGGLIGWGISQWELSRPHGLILTPFIGPDGTMGAHLSF